ncbi:hypothetical protein Y032_1072g3536 [Ancylostoma ceylanicum]|uniref:Uncharacterized protein n=1 Tax=Ancylostoma ceylanicum TaxID=53326 RepID=A0A016W684_9BILA|nr:hypothetical protein Y032_1072g3536 [Ancylostoma ceylanicum]
MRSYDKSSSPVSLRPKQKENQTMNTPPQALTSAKPSRRKTPITLAPENANYHIATIVCACFHSGPIALEQFAWTRRSRRAEV